MKITLDSATRICGWRQRPEPRHKIVDVDWDENAHQVSRYQLATMTDYVNKYTK
jgi:hypothetical protein